MYKRINISLDPTLHEQMTKCAKAMGMTLSGWIKFVARDKIKFFERHKDKYFTFEINKQAEKDSEEELMLENQQILVNTFEDLLRKYDEYVDKCIECKEKFVDFNEWSVNNGC